MLAGLNETQKNEICEFIVGRGDFIFFEKYFLEPDIFYVRSFGSKVKTSMQNFVWWAHETLLAKVIPNYVEKWRKSPILKDFILDFGII